MSRSRLKSYRITLQLLVFLHLILIALKATWGTPTHYSPELTYGAYGPQTDMWSLGCVVFEMLTGLNAFPPS